MKSKKSYVKPEFAEKNANYKDVLMVSGNPSVQDTEWDDDIIG